MGRSVTLGNGRDIDKDIELCRTTNEKTSEQTIHVLMENHIPFTKSWINIPFFLRRKFHGASQICVINTNRNRYSQARTAIDQMGYPLQETSCREQLLMRKSPVSSDSGDFPITDSIHAGFPQTVFGAAFWSSTQLQKRKGRDCIHWCIVHNAISGFLSSW